LCARAVGSSTAIASSAGTAPPAYAATEIATTTDTSGVPREKATAPFVSDAEELAAAAAFVASVFSSLSASRLRRRREAPHGHKRRLAAEERVPQSEPAAFAGHRAASVLRYQHCALPLFAIDGASASHVASMGCLHNTRRSIAPRSSAGSAPAELSAAASHVRPPFAAQISSHVMRGAAARNQRAAFGVAAISVKARSCFDRMPPGIDGESGQKKAPPFV